MYDQKLSIFDIKLLEMYVKEKREICLFYFEHYVVFHSGDSDLSVTRSLS